MPSNIEIKARAADWDRQLSLARPLADRTEILEQEDVFFNCPQGRLKLRTINGETSELIFYLRPDERGPKTSVYRRCPVAEPGPMKELLSAAYGRGTEVKKNRTVFLAGQTRIHFDQVERLGRFIELEVCLRDGQSVSEGERTARYLMTRLGISEKDLLASAYADLLH